MIALMLAAGVSATAAAQNINRVRELLEEMQQEVEMIEKRQAETATVVPVKTEPVESVADTNGVLPLDTLPTMNDAVKIVIYNDNTWKYMRDRQYVKDSAVYVQYWDTTTLFPYRDVTLASLPASVAIDLVDSLKCYHYPGKGKLRSKYGRAAAGNIREWTFRSRWANRFTPYSTDGCASRNTTAEATETWW